MKLSASQPRGLALRHHYLNKKVFCDRRNWLYDKSASMKCDGKLFHSPGLAATKALSPKLLWVRVMTHALLSVQRSRHSRASAIRWQASAKCDGKFPDSVRWTRVATLKSMDQGGNLEIDGPGWQPWNRWTRVATLKSMHCYTNT